MPAGLQTYNANNDLTLDTSTIVGRLIAIVDMTAMSGSMSIAGLDQGLPFAVPLLGPNIYPTTPQYDTLTIPRCTFSGNTVSWVRQDTPVGYAVPPCKVLIGIR